MSGYPMVCVHEASLSERAGIVWPGQLVGAGLKARTRLLLAGQADQPPAPPLPPLAPAAAAAAGGGGMPGSVTGHAAAAATAGGAACGGLTAGMLGPPGKQSSYMLAKRRSSGAGRDAAEVGCRKMRVILRCDVQCCVVRLFESLPGQITVCCSWLITCSGHAR
jgi:hypothetical protein